MIGGMAMKGFVLIAVAILSACRSAGAGTPPTTTVTPPAAAPAAADRDPDSIRWVRDSAEYYAAVLQVYRHAAARVESEARARTAGTWAVVLDADETVISNLTYQIERARLGLAFSPESWNAWVKRREATPLPGAAAFLSRVRDLGGRIAIVTNRLESECEDTAAVFRAHALVFDAMLCRPNGSPSDKNPRFPWPPARRQRDRHRSSSWPLSATTSRTFRGSLRRSGRPGTPRSSSSARGTSWCRTRCTAVGSRRERGLFQLSTLNFEL
jgi:hypothetical protein